MADEAAVVRSSNYPYITLQEAVTRAEEVWETFQKAAVDPATMGKAWGFSEKSSGLRSTVAALRQYGLIDATGWGETRKLKLSNRGLDIVTEQPGSPKRTKAIQDGALAPKIYSEVFAAFPDGLPSTDHAISSFLLREKDFNKNAVASFIADLRANLKFAQLTNPANITPAKADPTPWKEIAVGDMVQWESNGVLKMAAPMRVRAITDDAQWVFVDGSETGIPMAEVLLQTKGDQPAAVTPPTLPLDTGVKPLAPGEKEWRGDLSRDTTYRLIIKGEMGPKEIANLIRILTAQKEVLSEDE